MADKAETIPTHGNPFVERVYNAKSVDETKDAYNEWASKYDQDMLDQEYVGPALVADAAFRLASPDAVVLDAGCGTGAVGVELAKLGSTTVDGIDLSPDMLDVARKTGAYRHLKTADLSQKMDVADNTYDAVVCCGTLTKGHLGPSALADFVKVVKPGGVVVATVMDKLWSSNGYEREVERLEKDGLVKVISTEARSYRRSVEVLARIVSLKKL